MEKEKYVPFDPNNKKKGGNKNVKNASSASSTYVVQTRSKPC